jgi:CubicO group peptidase (beta-lactamase class C family)
MSGTVVAKPKHIDRLFLSVAMTLGFLLIRCGDASDPANAPTGALDATVDAATTPWPTDGWSTATPESQGIGSAELAALIGSILDDELEIHSLLLVRNGQLVLDATFYPYQRGGPVTVHDLASVTKSVTSALVGIAIGRGAINGLDDLVLDFFPGRAIANLDSAKKSMTVGHLLSMSSGFDCGVQRNEQELSAMFQSVDWVQFALDLPMAFIPGSDWAYCSPNTHLLSAIITETTGQSALEFAQEHLFAKLGIRQASWPTDPQGHSHGWGDLHLLPRDMAKIGYLYLHDGQWNGEQILPTGWVSASTTPYFTLSAERGYGLAWWLLTMGNVEAYYAYGRGNQSIFVWPDRNAVVVFRVGFF